MFNSNRGQFFPNQRPTIDWSHPLARDLIFYAYDYSLGPQDVAGNVPITIVNGGTLGPCDFPWSNALYFENTNDCYAELDSTSIIRSQTAANSYSIACAIVQLYGYDQYALPFSRVAGNGTVEPYVNWGFQATAGGSGSEGVPFAFAYNDAGSGVFSTSVTLDIGYHTLVATVSSASSYNYYADGALIQANTSATIETTDTEDPIYFAGGPSSLGNPWAGPMFFITFWGRPLTPFEALQLHTDPTCFLKFSQDGFLDSLVYEPIDYVPYRQSRPTRFIARPRLIRL